MRAWTPIELPRFEGLVMTKNPLYLATGSWTVVDGVFVRPKKGELVAQEVIADGDASVTVRGRATVYALGRSCVRAEKGSLIEVHQRSHITVLNGAEAHAMGDDSTIIAEAGAQVNLITGANPTLMVSPRALIVMDDGGIPRVRQAA